jgi:kynurenine formamidase
MRIDPIVAMLGCAACLCVTACSDSGTSKLANDAFQPSEIIDLGALVTEDLPERVWGKALLRENGWDEQNSFSVLTWEQELLGGVVSGSNSFFTIFNHGGPHVDAPNHIGLDYGLDGYPISVFSGPVKAFDVSGFPAGRTVGLDFFSEQEIASQDIVLIYTGYAPPAGDDDYPSTITLTREAAEYLAGIPVRAIGTDAWSLYSYDESRPAEAANALGRVAPIHEVFLSRGIPIYEQLFNVDQLLDKERMFFVGVPLNIEKGDGMTVRPVVFVY